MGKRSNVIGGGAVTVVSAMWGLYSFSTDVAELPDNAGALAKMLADPPIYLPWMIFVAAVIFVAVVLTQSDDERSNISVDLGLDRIRDDIRALQEKVETLATKDDLEAAKAELSQEIDALRQGLEEEAGHRTFLAKNARIVSHCTVAADQFSDCRPQITAIVEELCDDLYMLDDADAALGWNQRHLRFSHLEQQLWDIAGGDQELTDIIMTFTTPDDNEAQEFTDIGVPAPYSGKAAEVMRKALTIDAFFDNTIARLRRNAARAVLEIDGN